MPRNELQQQLIHSLRAMYEQDEDPQLMENLKYMKDIIAALGSVNIHNKDYAQVMTVLLDVIRIMPEVITAAPYNKSFIELCLLCDGHVPLAKNRRGRKHD